MSHFQSLLAISAALIVLVLIVALTSGSAFAQDAANRAYDGAIAGMRCTPRATGDLLSDLVGYAAPFRAIERARQLEELAAVLAYLGVVLLVVAIAVGGRLAWVN